MTKKSQVLKPGTIADTSGQYKTVGPKGGNVGVEITAIAGKPLPPTQKPGQGFVLVDPTKHKK